MREGDKEDKGKGEKGKKERRKKGKKGRKRRRGRKRKKRRWGETFENVDIGIGCRRGGEGGRGVTNRHFPLRRC